MAIFTRVSSVAASSLVSNSSLMTSASLPEIKRKKPGLKRQKPLSQSRIITIKGKSTYETRSRLSKGRQCIPDIVLKNESSIVQNC